jgi:DNA-binding transcriptional LysR family regulator
VSVIARFRAEHPGVRVRLVGQNSVEVAAAVREGAAEAGLVALPIDDTGLDVRPIARDEVVYATTDARRAGRPVTIERLAEAPLVLYDSRYAADDPTRRQLAERAQRAGRRIAPVIEVEDFDAALRIAAAGLADTVVATRYVRSQAFPPALHTTSLAEPMFDVLAFVTRRAAVLSPAGRELVRLIEDEKGALGAPM